MEQLFDAYATLRVAPTCDARAIRRARRAALRAVHPDLGDQANAAEIARRTRRAAEVNRAADILLDPSARVALDEALGRRQPPVAQPASSRATPPAGEQMTGARATESPPPASVRENQRAAGIERHAPRCTDSHHARTALRTWGGLRAFLRQDRLGQWLVALILLLPVLLTSRVSDPIGALNAWLLLLAGQAFIARRAHHTPIADLAWAAREVAIRLISLVVDAILVVSSPVA
ncbi:MAG TPA: DnaJ domain-containing protein [Acidimicrobiales bacterium]|nr:DnaJ domain-containing protein [Acidimicrobiales bacterium]